MYVAQISTSASLFQNNPITLVSTPILATNKNVSMNSTNNGLLIAKPGVYKVRLQLNATATSTGTALGAQLYANGSAVAMTAVSITVANSASGEIVIEYPVKVVASESSAQALVQFYATENGTVANGYVTVEKVS